MDATVAHELRGDAERFPAVRALVPLRLRVYAAVVFVRHQVGEFFLTGAAIVCARLMTVFVIEQGAGMEVTTPTLVTNMRFAAALRRILVTGLHQGQVKPRTPPEVRTASTRGTFRILMVRVV